MKMKDRNAQLRSAIGRIPTKEIIAEVNAIPNEDTVNRQGYSAYSLEDELRLLSMLNTIKLEPQYYRSETETMKELRDLIERLGLRDPYFIAQAIVYSRCMRDGMRSINHLAAALLAPFIAGEEYAKRFYGPFNKKAQQGGCIFRPDDMSEIKDVFSALNSHTLTNAMKKGFASAIESLDTYQLAKYKKPIIDIANLVHPKSSNSNATITVDNKEMKTLDAIMKGIAVTADTWESAQSEAGQIVAKAVKEGKLDREEADKVLTEAKADNWEALLKEGKLGILAALRNIRNIVKSDKVSIIELLCNLVSNGDIIKKGLIQPYQLDLAYEVLVEEFNANANANLVKNALLKGYELAIPNLKEALPGKTLIMIDCSGSMHMGCTSFNAKGKKIMRHTACDKAGLLAATIAKATNADVIRFGSRAEYCSYNSNTNVFDLAKQLSNTNMGGTNIAEAFKCATRANKKYDRIILLSDNEANCGCTKHAYQDYIRRVCSPYIYAVDLAAYGTVPVKNSDKVQYYFGYGYKLFDDIASLEFNPSAHIEKVRKVKI